MNTKKLNTLRWTVVLSSLIFSNYLFNQVNENTADSISKKKEFIYGLDNRRTHIDGQPTLIYGLYIGIGYRDKLRLKMGVSGIPFEVGRKRDENDLLHLNRFYFFNIGEEFDFYINNRFRLTTYLQAGIGENHYRKLDHNNDVIGFGRHLLIPLELGMHANYDIYPWLRAKLGGGWRFVLTEPSNNIAGYYVKVGFSISSRKLLKSYRKWKNEKDVKTFFEEE